MDAKKVLVVGGAGFIGSHVNKMLQKRGYETIILDNLSSGDPKTVLAGQFIEGDMANRSLLEKIFTKQRIEAVMHFGALTDVGESVLNPSIYYMNNVVNTLLLLEMMRKHNIKYFIFSSSAAIFGNPQEKYINETHPKVPINPYGQSKLMIETILQDFEKAYGLKFACLRYFNAAGGDPEGEIKNYKKKETNLIPIILKSLKNGTGKITIFGTDYNTPDGTCIRDYIHIDDLGSAHLKAMEKLFEGSSSLRYNLGNGKGFSVKEVIAAVEKTTGKKIIISEGRRRLGDPAFLLANSEKAFKEIGWKPQYPDLETMIEHAWKAI
jgi:UDP-glucose 4-epimerase